MLLVEMVFVSPLDLSLTTCLIAQQLMSVRTKLIVQASTPHVFNGLLPIALILPFPTTEAHVRKAGNFLFHRIIEYLSKKIRSVIEYLYLL